MPPANTGMSAAEAGRWLASVWVMAVEKPNR
jgi:hypothetical protein